jgi:2-polyprenyl-3-methyl-5-hydroxy-6-metoxy-1,4-benzoquinol methylase
MIQQTPSESSGQDEVVVGYHDLVRRDVFDLMPTGTGCLLDVGGGIGATAVALKHQGKASRVVVVDIVTEGFLPDVDNSFSGDLNDPKFLAKIATTEGQFDTILCLDVLEHLVDPWTVVRNLHSLLKPGGVIVASLPNMRFWGVSWGLFGRGRFDLTDKGHHDRTHMRWFVRNTAIELLTCSGLQLDEIVGKLPARRFRLFNAMTLGLVRGLFEYQYLIRVSKPN